MSKILKINLEDRDYNEFKHFLYDSCENPFGNQRIAEVILRQIEELEDLEIF
jgi:aromatic ring-opening dioxygenase catalytic subunit (LigB family)